jgi:hypothetical protein
MIHKGMTPPQRLDAAASEESRLPELHPVARQDEGSGRTPNAYSATGDAG